MCDQLPVELCKRLTLNELIALENLLIERGDAKRSTISEFLMDILENKRHCTKASDYIKILSEAMRRSYGESPYNLPPASTDSHQKTSSGSATAATTSPPNPPRQRPKRHRSPHSPKITLDTRTSTLYS